MLRDFIHQKILRPDGKIIPARCKKSYWSKNGYLEALIKETSFLGGDADISSRIWCFLNGIGETPKCYCGNTVRFHNGIPSEYCSNKCSSNSSKVIAGKVKGFYALGKEKIQEIKQRRFESYKKTCLKKYGKENLKQKHLPDIIENTEWLRKENQTKSLTKISRELGCSETTIRNRFVKKGIPILYHSDSTFELEVEKFLRDKNVEYALHSRKIIPPYELDFYLPKFNIAIECNGLYWHSTKPKNYHKEKTDSCSKKGIRLFHIFENEWRDSTKREIWKSIISNSIGSSRKIHARKCSVKKVDFTQTQKFLNENHLQGYIPSSVNLGLFFMNELVSIMTFSKTRYNKNYDWELLRFCHKKSTTVVGGASKLLKYSGIKNMITYCDLRYGTGEVYRNIGMKFLRNTTPNYFYWKTISKLESRIKYQKHRLKDFENYSEDKTEWEIMREQGFHRIYDCGNLVFEFTD